ncbi:uncharacterized protein LOC124639122 [Helicoverpa zea]|uniref:uncharacterized protein LOC124639122 n=1 Tax=Helicoverpa zea TaxID=7113 RepID=UPI001F5A58F1|nr:uncharacterized protein LOC124639122 [Helicoverpa zea]
MGLTVILGFLLLLFQVNLILIQGRPELGQVPIFRPDNYTHFDVYASALSKAHYNPWACDYRSEPGYKCLSCSSALHCYPGNFALLVQCAGLFPFCRNGYCSRFKTEGCLEEADPNTAHSHTSTMPPYVQVFNKVNKTTAGPESQQVTQTAVDNSEQQVATNTVATELNKPNKINAPSVTSAHASETANSYKKPKRYVPYSSDSGEVNWL